MCNRRPFCFWRFSAGFISQRFRCARFSPTVADLGCRQMLSVRKARLILPAVAALVLATATVRAEQPLRWRGYPTPRTGVAVLHVDSGTGKVHSVRIQNSTGDAKLDTVAARYFRRWRFKRGTAPLVRVPITFTKEGIVLPGYKTSNHAMGRPVAGSR